MQSRPWTRHTSAAAPETEPLSAGDTPLSPSQPPPWPLSNGELFLGGGGRGEVIRVIKQVFYTYIGCMSRSRKRCGDGETTEQREGCEVHRRRVRSKGKRRV